MTSRAVVSTVRGQTGLFFPLQIARLIHIYFPIIIPNFNYIQLFYFHLQSFRNIYEARQDAVPLDWIAEQTILRNFFCLNNKY